MSLVVDTHREYLSDRARLDAFARAIAATVKPGDVVIDLGSGTGILGLLACRAGAARVHAIESDGIVEVARAIARANGFAGRILFHPRHSDEVELPEQADVLVSDLIGRMGFEGGLFESYARARRWLKPGAAIIPASVTITVAPSDSAAAYADAAFWSTPVAGFDMSAALAWSMHTGYPRDVDRESLLSVDRVSGSFEAVHTGALQLRGAARVSRAGVLRGIAGWMTAHLTADVSMTNEPGASDRINRRSVFLPVEVPVAVEAGDEVTMAMKIRPAELLVSWRVEIDRGARGFERRSGSTLRGMLLSADVLKTLRPDATPALTPRGEARRTLLELTDGVRSVAEIEQQLLERHRPLFADVPGVQLFVAEVLARYGTLD